VGAHRGDHLPRDPVRVPARVGEEAGRERRRCTEDVIFVRGLSSIGERNREIGTPDITPRLVRKGAGERVAEKPWIIEVPNANGLDDNVKVVEIARVSRRVGKRNLIGI